MREQIMTEETTRATVKRKELARGVIEKSKLPVLGQVANNCEEM